MNVIIRIAYSPGICGGREWSDYFIFSWDLCAIINHLPIGKSPWSPESNSCTLIWSVGSSRSTGPNILEKKNNPINPSPLANSQILSPAYCGASWSANRNSVKFFKMPLPNMYRFFTNCSKNLMPITFRAVFWCALMSTNARPTVPAVTTSVPSLLQIQNEKFILSKVKGRISDGIAGKPLLD